MTNGGETTVKKAKVVEREKGPVTVDQRWTDTNPAPAKAKATKADPKGKENHTNLILAIAIPNHAATVGSLDTKIGNVGNDNTMKKKNKTTHTNNSQHASPLQVDETTMMFTQHAVFAYPYNTDN
jgi:hypothetical protein